MDIVAEIKRSVTVRQACERYGIDINRAGFARCIAHSERTPSMKIYNGDRGFHCFGCGAGGDVITFVRLLFNLDFKRTLERINDDFSLHLPIGRQMSEHEKIAAAKGRFERKKALEIKEKQQAELDTEFLSAVDVWLLYNQHIHDFAPKTVDEPLHPLFVSALQRIDYASYRADLADIRRACYAEERVKHQYSTIHS